MGRSAVPECPKEQDHPGVDVVSLDRPVAERQAGPRRLGDLEHRERLHGNAVRQRPLGDFRHFIGRCRPGQRAEVQAGCGGNGRQVPGELPGEDAGDLVVAAPVDPAHPADVAGEVTVVDESVAGAITKPTRRVGSMVLENEPT